MIKPTIGRIVWYTPFKTDVFPLIGRGTPEQQPHAAQVVGVFSDRCVNLAIHDANGQPYARTSVQLLQEGDEKPAEGGYAEWMPYQVQAAKKD